MQWADMVKYHRAQSKLFHERAQVARKEGLRCRDKGDWLGKLKADIRAAEYRRSRDHHKAKVKELSAAPEHLGKWPLTSRP